MRSGFKCSAAALGLLLTGLFPCHAKKADRLEPINTVGQSTVAYDGPNAVTTLTGNVKITQGSIVISGDVAKLYLDANQQIARAVVMGRPAHFQELDEQDRMVHGDAQTLDYDNVHQIAMLSINAMVKVEGQGEVHGDKLTYNIETTAMKAESGDEGFVHGVILSKPKKAASVGARP
jgi:lipopolysaccharide export system protein LptA